MREIYGTITDGADGKTITLAFRSAGQLLDESDPSPLPEKELTLRAEKEIVRYLEQVLLKKEVVLQVFLPAEEFTEELARNLPDTIRRHFRYRLWRHEQTMKMAWREGKVSTFIALLNVLVLVLISYWFFPHYLDSYAGVLLMGFFTILNWVTIWDTYEFFVYDWRRFIRKKKILTKITVMEIMTEGYTGYPPGMSSFNNRHL